MGRQKNVGGALPQMHPATGLFAIITINLFVNLGMVTVLSTF